MVKQLVNASAVYALANGVLTPEQLDKFAPQCQVIIKIITEAGGSITRFELLEEMTKQISATQPIVKILGYYKGKLEKANVITVTNPEKPAKKTAEEKAAEKAAKAEARAKAKEEAKAAKAAAKAAKTPKAEGVEVAVTA